MEFLKLFDLISEAENAETIAAQQEQIRGILELLTMNKNDDTTAIVITMFFFIGFAIWVGFVHYKVDKLKSRIENSTTEKS